MLDTNLIREKPDLIRDNIKKKFQDPDVVDRFLRSDKEWRDWKKKVDDLRFERNKLSEKINQAIASGSIDVRFSTNLLSIDKDYVTLESDKDNEIVSLKNDLVYIFAGGELPTQFLEKVGITITKKFGETILKH